MVQLQPPSKLTESLYTIWLPINSSVHTQHTYIRCVAVSLANHVTAFNICQLLVIANLCSVHTQTAKCVIAFTPCLLLTDSFDIFHKLITQGIFQNKRLKCNKNIKGGDESNKLRLNK